MRPVLLTTVLVLSLLAFAGAAQAQGLQGSSVLALDGIDDYATVPDGPAFDVGTGATDDFTLETMFRVSEGSSATRGTFFYKPLAYDVYVLFNVAGETDRILFKLWTGPLTSNNVYIWYETALTPGWHHIAAVFDNEYTADSDLAAIYLDGALVKTGTGVEWTPGLPNSSSALYVGGYLGINSFPGWLEETRVSNSVRYSGSSYAVPTAPFSTDSNTLALWHFNEASGATTFLDSSGGAHSLAGVNGAATHNDDATAPAAPTLAQPSSPTSRTAVSLTGTAEASSTVMLYDGGGLLGTTTAGSDGAFSFGATLANGSHSLTAKASDAAGNVSVASAAVSVTVDSIAPVPALTASPALPNGSSGWYKTKPRLTITSNEAGPLFYRIGSGSTMAYTTYLTVPNGTWTYWGWASDNVGNTSAAKSKTFKVDSYIPRATLTASNFYRTRPGTYITARTYEFKSMTVKATLRVKKYGTSTYVRTLWSNANKTASATGYANRVYWNGRNASNVLLPKGRYVIELRLTDPAGNAKTMSKVVSIL